MKIVMDAHHQKVYQLTDERVHQPRQWLGGGVLLSLGNGVVIEYDFEGLHVDNFGDKWATVVDVDLMSPPGELSREIRGFRFAGFVQV